MSCEHIIEKLNLIVDKFPVGSEEAVQPAVILQNLANSCRSGQSRITHTSKILIAADDAWMDSIWKSNKEAAKAYMDSLPKD